MDRDGRFILIRDRQGLYYVGCFFGSACVLRMFDPIFEAEQSGPDDQTSLRRPKEPEMLWTAKERYRKQRLVQH